MSRLEQGLIAALALLIAFTFGYAKGEGDEKARNQAAVADANSRLASAQTELADARANAASEQAQLELRLRTETDDALAEIARFRGRTPAPGSVGADALVDPALGVAVLCRIGGLRNEAPAQCGPAP